MLASSLSGASTMALLDGITAVVTGGSSGIGRGIARGFAEHGAEAVVVADIREEPKEDGPTSFSKRKPTPSRCSSSVT